MPHPLVLQLRFTRSEFQRGLAGLSDEEARRRFPPMNCISWNLGHLASQEQGCWLWLGQHRMLLPRIYEQFATGAPASTPALEEMWAAWQAITQAADPWLDSLTIHDLLEPRQSMIDGQPFAFSYGSLLHRTLYHYWYHLGESMAVRQMLVHTDLPQFVGNIDGEAPYIAESGG